MQYDTYSLFTLHGTKTNGDTGIKTGTIGNNESWSLFVSKTSVKISASYF